MIARIEDKQAKPWDREPGEPSLWFVRFVVYRNLGPCRNLRQAWINDPKCKAKTQKRREKSTNGADLAWGKKADLWAWKARAEAWDTIELERAEVIRLEVVSDNQRRIIEQELQAGEMLHELAMRTAKALPENGADYTEEWVDGIPALDADGRRIMINVIGDDGEPTGEKVPQLKLVKRKATLGQKIVVQSLQAASQMRRKAVGLPESVIGVTGAQGPTAIGTGGTVPVNAASVRDYKQALENALSVSADKMRELDTIRDVQDKLVEKRLPHIINDKDS